MKKHICGLLPILLVLSGCFNPLNQPKPPTAASGVPTPGMGRVVIGQAESQSRTILPQTPLFVSYLLQFQYQGEGGASKDNQIAASLPCSVELLPGPWLVTVTAYTRIEGVQGLADGNYPAALGSVTVTVNAGVSVPVTVNLSSGTALAGKGVLEYAIGLPNESIGGAVLRVLAMNKSEIAAKNLLEAASGNIVLDAGYYLLQVQVATGRARSKTELLHIYSGHTTRAAGSGWNFNTEEGVYLSVAELSEFLAAAPANTADNPYPVKLNVNLESLASRSSTNSNWVIPLGAFFNALHGKYVAVNLSDASGSMEVAAYDNYYDSAKVDTDKLVSVILPEGLTRIGTDAFNGCTSLKAINFPASLQSIGGAAFQNCSSLVLADFSACASLTTISGNVFANCSFLEEVILPDSVQTIGGGAFSGCSNLTEMVFPASLRNVGANSYPSSGGYTFQDSGITKADFSRCSAIQDWGFWGLFLRCVNLEEVILHPAITSLGAGMFFGCTSLENITLPASLKTVGERVFAQCTSLGTVALPAAVETISSQAFDGCASLVLSIPANSALKSIGANAFRGCTNYRTAMNFSGLQYLTSIDLSGYTELETLNLSGCIKLTSVNVTSLTALKQLNLSGCTQLNSVMAANLVNLEQVNVSGCTALPTVNFAGCSSLAAINMPASLSIGAKAFTGCANLTFSLSGSGSLSVDETGKILKTGNTIVSWPAASGNVNVPAGITAINNGALDDNISSLSFPVGITNFSNITEALKDIPSVQQLDFSSCVSITAISGNIFTGVLCPEASVIFPGTITNIAFNSLNGSSFKSIDISACTSLTVIYIENCASLETVKFPVLGSFSGTLRVYRCQSLVNFITGETGFFRTAVNGAVLTDNTGKWLSYPSAAGNVIIPEGTVSIKSDNANAWLDNGYSPFMNNTLITSVKIPSTLSGINAKTFEGCSNLTSFDTSSNSNYTTKGSGALLCASDGTLITWPSATGTVTLPAGVSVIGTCAFFGNNSITAVDFSNSTGLVRIEESAFSVCRNIVSFDFSGCSSLQSIGGYLIFKMAGAANIGFMNLSGCTALTSIGAWVISNQNNNPFSVEIDTNVPPSLSGRPFVYAPYVNDERIPSNITILVPQALLAAYKSAPGWSAYADKIQAKP